MNTLLFDIDGTLIRAGGAGLQAIESAMRALYPIDRFPEVSLHGRTDMAILTELFAAQQLEYPKLRRAFDPAYQRALPEALQRLPGEVLPGVQTLLERLAVREDVALGILTGNGEVAAEAKLCHFGLDHFFAFGAYGDHHGDRDDVARSALAAAKRHLGDRFHADRTWVIGDTVNDIRCARAIQARVLVVETGGVDPEQLSSGKPDLLVRDLSETDRFWNHLVSEMPTRG